MNRYAVVIRRSPWHRVGLLLAGLLRIGSIDGSLASGRRALIAAAASVGVLATSAACTSTQSPSTSHSPSSSATTSQQPVILTLATDDSPGEISAAQVTAFADRVHDLSGGAVEVKPDWNSNDDIAHDWDQATARLVIDGHHDLALVPSRAWDTLGVTSLQALSVPMLVTDQSLERAVVTDPTLSADLMAGLPAAGVVGLSLYPEGLRHPFAFHRRLAAPEDFTGGTLRAPTSAASAALYRALRATTVDDEPDPSAQIGLDSDFDHATRATVTGNLTWYAKVNVLVANSTSWGSLSDAQRSILQSAADDAQAEAIKALPSERDAAGTWCAQTGGTVATASERQLAAIAAAVAPVRRHLAGDPTTAGLIRAIESLKEATPRDPPVLSCPTPPTD